MIKLVNVSKIYNNSGVLTTGLHNISLELAKGEIVAITGESGSGKSTLLNVLTKMDLFDEGEYYYKGNETSYFDINDMDNFRKNKVGFIFQNYNIIDSYSVLENVMLPFKIKGMDNKHARARAMELIEKVGLKERWKNKGVQLSGGEKQRCVIARALASDCEILACDEPTGNLDSKTSAEIISLIKEVAKDKLVLIVTHNYEQVEDIVTRKIKVHNGEIIEDIIYEKMEPDEDITLDLDYVPLKRRIKSNIAKNNLVNTPKKTLLSTLVFLFIAIFAFSLYQSIYYMRDTERYNNCFIYQGENKVIVYNINDDHLVDMNKIKEVSSDYSINNFYESRGIYCNFNDYNIFDLHLGYESNPKDLKLDGGRMPENDNECILLICSENYIGNHYIDKEFTVSEYNIEKSSAFKVVGYQYRDDINYNILTACPAFESMLKIYNVLNEEGYVNLYYPISYGDYEVEPQLDIVDPSNVNSAYAKLSYDYSLEKTYISIPSWLSYYNKEKMTFSKLTYMGYDLGVDFSNYEIKCEDYYDGDVVIHIGNDFLEEIEKNPYEVTVYSDNVTGIISKLESSGLTCASVKTFSNETALEHFIINLWSYVSMIISTVVIVIIYFITYVILAKIYISKKKDYTILRTLGISKRDMKDIVAYEVMSQTIIVSVVTYLAIFITSKFVKTGFFVIFSKITLFSSILYFIVMLLFGLFIARRFNHRLFKFSVNATLKGGEAKND